MPTVPVSDLIPILQVAIGPVILISGVGLLLLSLTNRFARAIDRSRQLGGELRGSPEADAARLEAQIEIIYRRARVLRFSIIMSVLSILLAAVLIIVLFAAKLGRIEAGLAISALFVCCLLVLILSLVAFIRDIQLSLHALRLELAEATGETESVSAAARP